MTNNLEISNLSLLLSSVLLIVALLIDYKEKLGLGNDIFIAGIRAVVQLFLIGYVLSYVLRVDNNFLTLAMVLFIVFNASYNAHTRSEGINRSFKISTTAIGVGTALSLLILVFSGVIDWTPSQIVPITGMIASNAMTAIGVTYRSLNSKFTDQRQQVLEKLALGANKKQASMSIVRESVKTGMAPSFAGIDPVQAIRYQIVVMFMLISVTAISSFIASYMAYREFYNNRSQLII